MVLFLTAHHFQVWLCLSSLQTQHKFLHHHHSPLAHSSSGLARQQSPHPVQGPALSGEDQLSVQTGSQTFVPTFFQVTLRQKVKVCLTGEFLLCSNSWLCNWTKTINSFSLVQQRHIRNQFHPLPAETAFRLHLHLLSLPKLILQPVIGQCCWWTGSCSRAVSSVLTMPGTIQRLWARAGLH